MDNNQEEEKQELFTEEMGMAIYIWPEELYVHSMKQESNDYKTALSQSVPSRRDMRQIIKNTYG